MDPLSILAGDLNFYRYVGNKSTAINDPLGLFEDQGSGGDHSSSQKAQDPDQQWLDYGVQLKLWDERMAVIYRRANAQTQLNLLRQMSAEIEKYLRLHKWHVEQDQRMAALLNVYVRYTLGEMKPPSPAMPTKPMTPPGANPPSIGPGAPPTIAPGGPSLQPVPGGPQPSTPPGGSGVGSSHSNRGYLRPTDDPLVEALIREGWSEEAAIFIVYGPVGF
jgi:hypothetical protein